MIVKRNTKVDLYHFYHCTKNEIGTFGEARRMVVVEKEIYTKTWFSTEISKAIGIFSSVNRHAWNSQKSSCNDIGQSENGSELSYGCQEKY